jgi:hypothetical protein
MSSPIIIITRPHPDSVKVYDMPSDDVVTALRELADQLEKDAQS